MYEEDFAERLSVLRNMRGVSARDMSLSIGQNPGYIHSIESGKSLPSMSAFFFICEYLRITPEEFFDSRTSHPEQIRCISEKMMRLSREQLGLVRGIVEEFEKQNGGKNPA